MNGSREELDRLADALALEISEMSDEAIIELAQLKGYDTDVARRVQGQADAALSAAKRAKLIRARQDLDRGDQAIRSTPDVVDLATMRARLQAAVNNNDSQFARITLAARDGKGVPDADIRALYEDAISLGLIKIEGDDC